MSQTWNLVKQYRSAYHSTQSLEREKSIFNKKDKNYCEYLAATCCTSHWVDYGQTDPLGGGGACIIPEGKGCEAGEALEI